MATKCCKVSYTKRIKMSPTEVECRPCCPKTGQCVVLLDTLGFGSHVRTSPFCFAVYVKENGLPKKTYDKESLSFAYGWEASTFAYDAYEAYSDVVNSPSGFETKKLVDTCGGWKFAKRKLTGQCVNTGIIYKAWPAIREAGVYSSFDWTIMADAGAVFFVDQLIPSIQLMPVPPSGAFLWNCPKMDFGFCCSLGARNLDVCQVLGDSCTFDVGGLILLKCSA